jgi:hypothetical protein
MGAAQSSFDPRYVRIWNNLSSLESTSARIKMLDTLFSAQEYINVAKKAGLYAGLLQWKAAQHRGEYSPWPGTKLEPPRGGVALAVIPPPKRALDVLHQSYDILGIDDTKPLTHDMLRSAYKKAATRAHPDKGGSPEAFDSVTRAFLYLKEVLDKLIPKTSSGEGDMRFTTPVTVEEALKQRNGVPAAPAGTPQLTDAPPIALNPKKLDMALFNKLFEENKLPDPDQEDGYGDWLRANDSSREVNTQNSQALRSKYNADVFNKMFEEETRRSGSSNSVALSKYKPPSELFMSPGLGSEIGTGRPDQYTQIVGSNGINYTDLKYAYGEGSTFSQQVADVSLEGRPKTLEQAKLEYGSAPKPMSADEVAAVSAFEKSRELAEQQRLQRVAAQKVDAEAYSNKLKGRLLIK